MASYVYRPLATSPLPESHELARNEIRLIRLHPGCGSDTSLTCEIRHCTLEEAEAIGYWALSYVWGDRDDLSIVETPAGSVQVTQNLHNALMHLRDVADCPLIWADALCINQGDVPERSYQVSLMGVIYSRASRVFVWLGDDAWEENPFVPLEKLRDSALAVWESYKNMHGRQEMSSDDMLAGQVKDLSSAEVESLARLLSLEWFRRKWVIQEVALSRDAVVRCGEHSTAWDTFRTVSKACEGSLLMENIKRRLQREGLGSKLHERSMVGLENAILMGYLSRGSTFSEFENKPGMFKYGHLLVCTSQFHCTDQRDHVITIVNLMKTLDSSQAQLSLRSLQDYSLSFTDLFVRMIRWLVIHEGYTLLRQVTPRPTTCGIRDPLDGHPTIPSWAYLPPYSGGNSASGFDPTHPISIYARSKQFRLDLSRLSALGNPGFSSDGKLLLARGRRVAVISHTQFAFRTPDGTRICRHSPLPSDQDVERHGGNFVIVNPDRANDPVASSIVTAYDMLGDFATRIQDQVELGSPGIVSNPWARERQRHPSIQMSISLYHAKSRKPGGDQAWDISQLKRQWQTRKFCLLSGVVLPPERYGIGRKGAKGDPDRRMALVPPHSTLGDIVVSFEGCAILFALRSCGHGHWSLLGEATVADFIGPEHHYTEGFVNETFEVC